MHGDIESFFGESHDQVYHDTHHPDEVDETALYPLDTSAQVFNFGTNLTDFQPYQNSVPDIHSIGFDHHEHNTDFDTHDLREWQNVGNTDNTVHLHLLRHSTAVDSNSDGISDAASTDLHIDPFNGNIHPTVNLDWRDASGQVHHDHSIDSDGDGWSDGLERLVGTDPYNAASHPSLVEAHHFPAGSDENLPGTVDVTTSSLLWQLP